MTAPPAGDPFIVTVGSDDTSIVWTDLRTRATGSWSVPDGPAEPSVSPDGQHVVYTWDDGTDGGIEVLDAVTGVTTRLTDLADGDVYDDSPSVSPDGTTVLFTHNDSGENNLATVQSIPVGGGQAQTFTTVVGFVAVASYGSDGSIFFAPSAIGPDFTPTQDCRLLNVSAPGGQATCVLTPAQLETATGAAVSAVVQVGAGTASGAVPIVIGWYPSDTSLVSEVGVATDVSGVTGVSLLSSTTATTQFDSDGDPTSIDLVSTPTLDPSASEVIYERDVATPTVTNLAEYSGDVATGKHRARIASAGDGDGEGSYFPPVPATVSSYIPLATPQRILDTRTGVGLSSGTPAKLAAATPVDLQVTGSGPPAVVPTGATAVVLNVTVIRPTLTSYVQVYPTPTTGSGFPTVSDVDLRAGAVLPNVVTVALPTSGSIRIRVSAGATDVAADVTGYYVGGGALSTGGLFEPESTPVRVLDTRNGTGGVPTAPLAPGGSVDLTLGGTNNVPIDATAVVLDLGGIEHTNPAFVTAFPTPTSGNAAPTTSTLDLAGAGVTLENLTTVGLGANGQVRIYNSAGSTDVFADLVGFYQPFGDGGSEFVPLSPSRILDTRDGTDLVNGRPGAIGQNGVTDGRGTGELTTAYGTNTVPVTANAIEVNLTAVGTTAATYLSLYATPTNNSRSVFSTIDVPKGATLASEAITDIGTAGQVRLFNLAGSTGALLDLAGYFVPSS